MSVCERWCVDINGVRVDTVDFHSRLMVSCLSPTSVPFLACCGSGWPRCHLAARCHVWAGAGWGPLPSPGLLLLLPLHGGAPMGLGCGLGWGEVGEEGEGARRSLKHTSGLKKHC